MLSKRSLMKKGVHTIQFHLYIINANQSIVTTRLVGGITQKGRGISWGDGHVHQLDCAGGVMIVYMSILSNPIY